MRKPIVFMFSGQGSQYYGMGSDLYRSDARFRHHADHLDRLARDLIGISLLQIIHSENRRSSDPFDDVATSSAAIFLVERALSRCLLDYGVEPDACVASSMGLYAALALAGCITDEEALVTAFRQGEIFSRTCEPGDMTAVLGTLDVFQHIHPLRELADVAGINFDKAFVIATPERNRLSVDGLLKRFELMTQKLTVSRPFHSRWTDPAKPHLIDLLRPLGVRAPQIPVACCAHRDFVKSFTAETIWHAVRSPIMFGSTINRLEETGPKRYIDLGPSGTLATILKYALPSGSQSEINFILSPFGQSERRLQAVMSSPRE